MKRAVLYIVALLAGITLWAQDGQPNEWIKNNYNFDAELLSVREIQQDSQHRFADSVFVPSELKNKYLNILSSIYLSQNNNIADTLFNTYKIHVWAEYSVISIKVNPLTKWVHTIINDSIRSGNETLDSILNTYSFAFDHKLDLGADYFIVIKSPLTLNLTPVIKKIEKIEGVILAEYYGYQIELVPIDCSDEGTNDIQYSKTENTEYLTFSKGMNACPNYCFSPRIWKFEITNEHEAHFVESKCLVPDNAETFTTSTCYAYPNPFNNTLKLNGLSGTEEITIFTSSGAIVHKCKASENELYLNKLPEGIYFIQIINGDKTQIKKVLKR